MRFIRRGDQQAAPGPNHRIVAPWFPGQEVFSASRAGALSFCTPSILCSATSPLGNASGQRLELGSRRVDINPAMQLQAPVGHGDLLAKYGAREVAVVIGQQGRLGGHAAMIGTVRRYHPPFSDLSVSGL